MTQTQRLMLRGLTLLSAVAVLCGAVGGIFSPAGGDLGARPYTGTAGITPILSTSLEEFRAICDGNLTSTFLACRYGAPHMVENGSGSIIAHSVSRQSARRRGAASVITPASSATRAERARAPPTSPRGRSATAAAAGPHPAGRADCRRDRRSRTRVPVGAGGEQFQSAGAQRGQRFRPGAGATRHRATLSAPHHGKGPVRPPTEPADRFPIFAGFA